MRSTTISAVVAVALLVFAGCSGSEQEPTPDSTPAKDITAEAGRAPAGSFIGKVAETMNSGGYTYVRLENESESVWAAAQQTAIEVGTEIQVSTAMPMKDFHSDTLGRTFETLYFVGGFEPTAPHDHAPGDPHTDFMEGDQASTPAAGTGAQHGATPGVDVAAGSIEAVEGGMTVEGLYARRSDLAGTSAKVRGKVVKFNGGIMGRNWIHLQDGSGDAAAKTHDLLITTTASCKVGDVVTVSGRVAVDKDFGSGYKYTLLLEEADVQVETAAGSGS